MYCSKKERQVRLQKFNNCFYKNNKPVITINVFIAT